MVILAEELLLLAFDPQSGRNKAAHLDNGLAGALLLDLVHANRLASSKRRLVVADPRPVGHPLLDELLEAMIARSKWRAHSWVSRWHWNLRQRVADELVSQGVLRLDIDRILKLFPFRRYRPARPRQPDEVRRRLESAVADSAWDARTAALGGLVYATRMEKQALPRQRRWRVRPKLRPVAKGRWTGHGPAASMQPEHHLLSIEILDAVAARSSNGGGGGGDGGDGGG